MPMVVTDARATILTFDEAVIDLTRDLLGTTVQESIGGTPSGNLELPLYRSNRDGVRRPYRELVQPGDLLKIELFAWDGQRGGWVTVLHGPVTGVSEGIVVNNDNFVVGTVLMARAMTHVLEQDTVAWWMYFGEVEGWAGWRAYLKPDEANDAPYRVAYNYLTKVSFRRETYEFADRSLDDLVHLDFSGLGGLAALEYNLSMNEGSHISIITPLLDRPFHELYTTTLTPEELRGDLVRYASRAPGENKGATTLVCRKAPYPYADENLKGKTDEWQALPLTELDGSLAPVGTFNAGRSDAQVRNFFMTFPALQFASELALFALGATIGNEASVRRFGLRPLKTSTHLIVGDQKDKDLEAFMLRINARLAGQHNRLDEMHNGTAATRLDPTVRVGTRVRAPSPWHAGAAHEWHVGGRTLSYRPNGGGSMQLTLERGLPVTTYADPAWFASGLKSIRTGAQVNARLFPAEATPKSR